MDFVHPHQYLPTAEDPISAVGWPVLGTVV